MTELLTHGDAVGIPLPEYPRPQLRRDSFINLNGKWQYAITKSDLTPESYDGEILVPYSPESAASGVERTVGKTDVLHYYRTFTLPEGFFRGRVLINFGAVDQRAEVFVNGINVGCHAGGYLPFTFDITNALRDGENALDVVVRDNTDDETMPRGRQSYSPKGIWHTAFSGIWQTVWLESVPEEYISSLTITPDFDKNSVKVSAEGVSEGSVTVSTGGVTVCAGELKDGECTVEIPDFHPWSCDDPFLYDLTVTSGDDRVESYFGMRKFSTDLYRDRYVTTINNSPTFIRGIMDQGMWLDGIMTPPDDESMVRDIETAKAMGFNMIRKHGKIEPLRWYYHCDRLGMLVWQDMVCSGGLQESGLTRALGHLGMLMKDNHYTLYGRRSMAGRIQFKEDCLATVNALKNCVSLNTWVLFSRGEGQFDSMLLTQMLWDKDPTRLVDSASGWHDQGGGDFKSRHCYNHRINLRGDRGRALALSGFGSFGLGVEGHCPEDMHFCRELFGTCDKVASEFERLMTSEVIPLVKAQRLSVCIYTQLTDAQEELDGLITSDRAVMKVPVERIRPLVEQLRFDAEK